MGDIRSDLRKTRAKKVVGSITKGFLESIFMVLSVTSSLSQHRFSMYYSLRKMSYKSWSDSQFSKAISDASKRGYLRVTENNSIEFTEKAKLKILDKVVEKCEKDGKNRFLSWDIPEDQRDKRDAFRKIIKTLGFKQVQKSLWVCDVNVGGLIEIACRELKVEKYVAYIISEKSDIDDYIAVLLSRK